MESRHPVRFTQPLRRAALAAVAIAAPAAAQPDVRGSVTVSSAYVWRGVTNTNRLVLQPDVALSLPAGGGTLTAGAWASIEPVRYDGVSDISAVYGLLPGPAFTQSSAWIEYGATVAAIDLAAGATAYTYPRVGGLAAEFNTVELYASLTLAAPLAPSVTAWYDVAAVRGAYVETSVAHDVGVGVVPVTLAASGGLNLGQGPDAAGRQAYFARRGLTHLAVSASSTFDAMQITVEPIVQVIRAVDPMARFTTPTAGRALKFLFGTTLAWSSSRGAER
jgi:hypothetical protein